MTLNDWQTFSREGWEILFRSSETWALESVAPDQISRKYQDPRNMKK